MCFQELINSWCFNFIHPCFRLHSGSSLHQLGSYSFFFLSTVSIENGYARPPCDNTDTTSEYHHCQKLNSVAVMKLISVVYRVISEMQSLRCILCAIIHNCIHEHSITFAPFCTDLANSENIICKKIYTACQAD